MTSTELATTDHLGPAMRALPTEKMRAFVVALVETGGSGADAAALAGYKHANRQTLRSAASSLLRDERVQAAIHEESIKQLRADGPMALGVLRSIAKDKGVAPRDRIRAATEILSRGGFHATTEQHIQVDLTSMTDEELRRSALKIATDLGFDDAHKARLLGNKAFGLEKPVDVEFQEVIVDPPSDIAPPRAPQGRPIKNPDDAEKRAYERVYKALTPEQRAERKAQTRARQSAEGKAKLAAARAARGEAEPAPPEDPLDEEIRRLVGG
jgi:hypothetical protein